MDCLALVLQPSQGNDLLLQTKSWFPPARARAASDAFLRTRAADTVLKQQMKDPSNNQAMMLDRLGDDPLAAASGQVVVGGDRSYRVVYRLVNTIYVLGIMLADEDDTSLNVFHCITAVNQTVSVLVAASRGVEVTPEKVFRKYTEIYIGVRHILGGIGSTRLAAVLAAVHGDGSALLSPLAVATLSQQENRARGSSSWHPTRASCVQRLANVEVLSKSSFELPEETLAVGDAAMAVFAPPPSQVAFETPSKPRQPKPMVGAAPVDPNDPFAASDSLLLGAPGGDNLLGGLQEGTALAPTPDPAALLLAELEAPGPGGSLGPADVFGVDPVADAFGDDLEAAAAFGLALEDEGAGDAGDPWGSAFGGSALLGGDSDAWGGGLDAAEFGVDEAAAAVDGLDGHPGPGPTPGAGLEAALGLATPIGDSLLPGVPAAVVPAKPQPPKMPTFRIEERISVEFVGPSCARLRLQGTIVLGYSLKAVQGHAKAAAAASTGAAGAAGQGGAGAPGSGSPLEFSFRLDGAAGIRRAVVRSSLATALGRGYFHIKLLPERPPPLKTAAGQGRGQQSDQGGAAAQTAQGNGAALMLMDLEEQDESAVTTGKGGLHSNGVGGAASQAGPGEQDWIEEAVLRYRLLPQFTPVPLRVGLLTRRDEENVSLMIQYVANPYLQFPLTDVLFALALPFSPASLRVSPAAELDPWSKQLQWRVPDILPNTAPQRLRAQLPIISDRFLRPHSEEEPSEEEQRAEEERVAAQMAMFKVRVSFKSVGNSLSGIAVLEAVVSPRAPFLVDERSFFESDQYLCSA